MATTPTKVGITGCGAVSRYYLQNVGSFEAFDLVAVADARLEAAQSHAKEFGIPKACSVDALLNDAAINTFRKGI